MVVWIHAAVGLYSWLVLKPVWKRIGGLVLPVLFAIPVLALIGFAESGKEVVEKLATDPAWRAHITENLKKIVAGHRPAQCAAGAHPSRSMACWCSSAAGVLALAHAARAFAWCSVSYDEGFSARGRRGLSILEMSLANDMPHAHVCSARGRCGTCRVRVEAGAASLSPRSELEAFTLGARRRRRRTIGLPARRACSAPGSSVTRLLPAYADASAARTPEEWATP